MAIYTIDTDKETTPSNYAKKLGVNSNVVNNWIARDQIRYRTIEELNLTLVEIGSEDEMIKARRIKVIKMLLESEEGKKLIEEEKKKKK